MKGRTIDTCGPEVENVRQVTVYVHDSVYGRPAAGVPVRVECDAPGGWVVLLTGETGEDGTVTVSDDRCRAPASRRLTLDTGSYYAALGVQSRLAGLTLSVPVAPHGGRERVTVTLAPCGSTVYVGG
jgi:5-hydroxyisourate hydrolase